MKYVCLLKKAIFLNWENTSQLSLVEQALPTYVTTSFSS